MLLLAAAAVASLLAASLDAGAAALPPSIAPANDDALRRENAALRAELAQLRVQLAKMNEEQQTDGSDDEASPLRPPGSGAVTQLMDGQCPLAPRPPWTGPWPRSHRSPGQVSAAALRILISASRIRIPYYINM